MSSRRLDRWEKKERRRIRKQASSTKPQPLAPIRSWIGRDGDITYGIHPLLAAIRDRYEARRLPEARRILDEILSGQRRLPASVIELVLEFDRAQQAEGCEDENILGLIELLRGCYPEEAPQR